MENKIIHRVIDYDRLSQKAKKAHGIESWDSLGLRYAAQLHYPGQRAVLIIHPNRLFCAVVLADGTTVDGCRDVIQAARLLLHFYVEVGEPVALIGTLTSVRGRQQFIADDMLLGTELEDGQSYREFSSRYTKLALRLRDQSPTAYVRLCGTYSPNSYGHPQLFANAVYEQHTGATGIVLRNPAGKWSAKGEDTGPMIRVLSDEC